MDKALLEIGTLKVVKEKIEDILFNENTFNDTAEVVRRFRVWLNNQISGSKSLSVPGFLLSQYKNLFYLW